MPEDISEGGMQITIPDPLNTTRVYDYKLFVIDCAKQLYSANYFGEIEGQEKLDEVKLAKDAIHRAEILANELFVNEYLDDASSIAEKSPNKNKNSEAENSPRKSFNPSEAIKNIEELVKNRKKTGN